MSGKLMPIDWLANDNRLFGLIDRQGEPYFSGGRFIDKVREVHPYFPTYSQYIAERRPSGKSTSRRDYFYDILLQFDEAARMRIISIILDEVEHCDIDLATEIRALMDGLGNGTRVVVHPSTWNANRLNGYLAQIDASIAANQYDRAVSLSYTCLEGFYAAFLRKKNPSNIPPNEIIALSRQIRKLLQETIANYPIEVLNLINHVSHAVDQARNRFSEAHFGSEAGRWLATYI